jgi:hypothetical protein
MRMKTLIAGVATVAIATAAFAAITFDGATGIGFVGKGDVQLLFGLNNRQIQSAAVSFSAKSETETETTWDCINDNNGRENERSRSVSTKIRGVVSATAWEKNQVTGYILSGYVDGGNENTSTEGPAVGSCPNNHTYDPTSLVVGEPVTETTLWAVINEDSRKMDLQ